jgi:hypothetical protein
VLHDDFVFHDRQRTAVGHIEGADAFSLRSMRACTSLPTWVYNLADMARIAAEEGVRA